MRSRLLGVAVLTLGVALAGCAASVPESTSTSTAPATASGEGTAAAAAPTPTATAAAAAAAVFPRCEDLIPIELLQQNFSTDVVAYTDGGGWTIGQLLPGPMARSAVEKAERAVDCGWGVRGGSDGGVHAAVLELPAEVRDELVSALRTADGYTEAAIDDATVFTSAVHGEIADGAVGYAFEGTTWLAIVGNSKEAAMQSAYLPAAVAALRAANAG
ncbi:hypothetical protein [Microbacterium hominis]|uniref:hypothetical protein n=2 Tax=Microbacterium hominis TaxID=162426 RepID=UPI00077C6766|nr:hypothetical protein [Microbacterium hominis]